MIEQDFITYLKSLKPADWDKPCTSQWTVKDVVAHMVGWEKGDAEVIRETWQTKRRPWFYMVDNFDDFNAKNVEFFRHYTPKQLITVWEKYQLQTVQEIQRIGEENLRANPKLFGWLFEQVKDSGSHYQHHFRQIQQAVENR